MEEEIKQFRNSKEWKEKRLKLIKDRGGKCEWCGSTDRLTPAHKHREYDFHKQKYIDWYKDFDNCYLACAKCHFAHSKGLIICKICKKKYHKFRWDTCWNCNPKKEEIEIRKIKEEIEDLEEGKDYFENLGGLSFFYHDSPYECYICGNDGEYEDVDGYEQYCFCKKCLKLKDRVGIAFKKYNKIQEERNKKNEEKIKALRNKLKAHTH